MMTSARPAGTPIVYGACGGAPSPLPTDCCMLKDVDVIVARHMGFCGGVKRAVEMARNTAQSSEGSVYTWGPL
ncbi:MAG: hypothetical protein ACRDF6_03580, partial [bacterium]